MCPYQMNYVVIIISIAFLLTFRHLICQYLGSWSMSRARILTTPRPHYQRVCFVLLPQLIQRNEILRNTGTTDDSRHYFSRAKLNDHSATNLQKIIKIYRTPISKHARNGYRQYYIYKVGNSVTLSWVVSF